MISVGVVGATGFVGRKILELLLERSFPFAELRLFASERSKGKVIQLDGRNFIVEGIEDLLINPPSLALFSAGSKLSLDIGRELAERGTWVIDNSSAWRMEAEVPLVVPEVNAHTLSADKKLIANPNCSTIQMVMALAPLHSAFDIKRLVISTYQSVSGSGKNAMEQLVGEEKDIKSVERVYPHQIYRNCIPHCDVFLENDYSREEMKLVHETRKIIGDDSIAITATCVRVPVFGGHSESVNIEFENPFEIKEIRSILSASPGVEILDDIDKNQYPMPLQAYEKDSVFVGRIRRDESQANTCNLWIVSDNIRKGAATNTIQIAEELIKREFLN